MGNFAILLFGDCRFFKNIKTLIWGWILECRSAESVHWDKCWVFLHFYVSPWKPSNFWTDFQCNFQSGDFLTPVEILTKSVGKMNAGAVLAVTAWSTKVLERAFLWQLLVWPNSTNFEKGSLTTTTATVGKMSAGRCLLSRNSGGAAAAAQRARLAPPKFRREQSAVWRAQSAVRQSRKALTPDHPNQGQ